MFNRKLTTALAAATLMAALASTAGAQTSTKDIVLDRVAAPAARTTSPGAAPAASATANGDAMVASVLLESADGTLRPRGTDKMFRTGDRFRVKLLTSRDARILLFNTKPNGQLVEKPVWQGEAKFGQELITPRLRLEGQSGVDQLHVVMQPVLEQGVFAWLGNWLARLGSGTKAATGTADGASKDIVLDVQNTESATYLLNARGQGLVTTVSIAHR